MKLSSTSQVVAATVVTSVGVSLRFPVGSRIKRKHGKDVFIRGSEVSYKPGSFWIIHAETKLICSIEWANDLLDHWELAEPTGANNNA